MFLRFAHYSFKHIAPNSFSKPFSSISEIIEKNAAGDVVTVQGWVKSLRNQKENVFIDVTDGSSDKKIQIFIPKAAKPPNLTAGASVVAQGALALSPKGHLELAARSVEVCGECVVSEGYPFAPRKEYEAEYVRQHLHFRPRTSKFASLLRIRSAASLAVHDFFGTRGFTKVDTPILTSNDCEGAGEVFKVVPGNREVLEAMRTEGQNEDDVYFNRKSYLTVSGQLHLEAAAHGLSRVYTFGPTFRAENSRSRLHLSEFYMLEAEIAFVERLQEILNLVERLMKFVTVQVLDKVEQDVVRCRGDESRVRWIDEDFPVLTYQEAVRIIQDHREQFKDNSQYLNKEHELFLVNYCGNVPVFVTEWPKELKPFYMRETDDGQVAAFDLLGPNVGEIVGGSLRENRYDKLKAQIPHQSNLDWYLELRKFGSVPTGGFGLGFERYLQSILAIGNIKDVIPFPRWPHNCSM